MAVKYEIIDGSRIEEVQGRITCTRVAYVDGLEGTESRRMYDALQVVPSYNAPHPTIPYIRVRQRSAEPRGATQAIVTLVYSTPTGGVASQSEDTPIYQVGASLQQVQSGVDAAGNTIKVGYTPPGGSAQEISASVSLLKPRATFNVSRREQANSAFPVGDRALEYVGKTNATTWQGQPPGTWLCTGITGSTTDGMETYDVRYEFEYNPLGWDPEVVFVDEATGRPPRDITFPEGTGDIGGAPVNSTGVGTKRVYGYIRKDFDELEL